MATQHINPDGMAKPGAYSHVVIGTGTRIVSVAGQVGLDADGQLVGKGDFAAQALQAYRNVETALAAAGAGFDDVTKMTVFIVGYDEAVHFKPLIAARSEVIPGKKPANTLLGVQALASPDFLIEVEAQAVLD
jgi:enamine deaminase RidA (YjgF/YER057c/UK114 family)